MSGKILNFVSISNLCHITPYRFCFGEIWQCFQLVWIVAILVMESHGVACNSIRCSMPDKGFAGVCSSVGLGCNSRGKSLKTSLTALSKDQVSISESEPESFVERSKVCSGCGIVWTLVISAGCSMLGFCVACGLCLLLLYLP